MMSNIGTPLLFPVGEVTVILQDKYLAMLQLICYNMDCREEKSYHCLATNENPRSCNSWGFLTFYVGLTVIF